MNESERQTLTAIIQNRIERLDIILKTGDVLGQQADKELAYDESVRLDNLSHQGVDENLYLIAKQELSQLKLNLKWLESEEAGECDECGDEIPIKRLLAVPTTRKCVNCAD